MIEVLAVLVLAVCFIASVALTFGVWVQLCDDEPDPKYARSTSAFALGMFVALDVLFAGALIWIAG